MRIRTILPGLLFLTSTHVWAARPFITDDARLATEGSCQLESWSRIYQDTVEFWALPACNPTGNFEISAGIGLAKDDGESATHDYVLQFKSLFKALTTNSWGIGIAVGTVQHPEIRPGPNQLGNHYAYIPYSASFLDDKIVLHANMGWLHDRESDQDSTTWGIGGEFMMTPKASGIFEVFGDNRDSPYTQAGLRYSVIPGLFQIDTSIGTQVSGKQEDTWVSFGLRLTPDHL